MPEYARDKPACFPPTAAKELAKAEKQINEHNKLFKKGNSTFYEKLNKYSDVAKDLFEKVATL
jgi:hypothetical protein